MPLYDYICPDGHTDELFRGIGSREDPHECSHCGKPSRLTIIGTTGQKAEPERENGVVIKWKYGKPANIFHMREYVCGDCEYSDSCDCTSEDGKYDSSGVRCEACGSANVKISWPLHMIDRFSERFPYFDRGLGMMLFSKAHRREVCRRRGLTPVDGNFDIAETSAEQRRQEAEDVAILKEMRNLMDDHPGYSEYRRMKDRGWKSNFKHRKQ
jgi:hypothetical protein